MLRIFTLICFSLSLLLSSCTEKLEFRDIYLTDDNGSPLGGASDPNEWELRTGFDEEVSSLFSNYKEICDEDEAYAIFAAYPNPFIDNINFFFRANNNDVFEMKVVTEELDVLFEFTSTNEVNTGNNTLTFNLEDELTSLETVRAYYRIIRDDCEYRGYGDIRKQ